MTSSLSVPIHDHPGVVTPVMIPYALRLCYHLFEKGSKGRSRDGADDHATVNLKVIITRRANRSE